MIHLLILAIHLLATIAKLLRPGGVRAVVAESLLLKHQLVISSRARRRAPNLNSVDRFVFGLGSLFIPAGRLPNLAVTLKPRTLLRFHEGSSSTRSSSSSVAIPGLAVPASPRRLRGPLASISTKTSSAACSRGIIDPEQELMVPLG